MSGDPQAPMPPSANRLMSPTKARDIARGLRWMTSTYAEAGMTREASIAWRDSEWWLAHAITLTQTGDDA